MESQEWQLGELQSGIEDLDSGRVVAHEKVADCLKSWGKPDEGKAPRGELSWSQQRAIAQLESLRDHIAKDSEESAAKVAARILEAINLLAASPEMGRPGRIPGTRELVVSGTPFVIPYRVRLGASGTDCGLPRTPELAWTTLEKPGWLAKACNLPKLDTDFHDCGGAAEDLVLRVRDQS